MKKTLITTLLFLIISPLLKAQKIDVSYAADLLKDGFSGNVLLFLSKENRSPKDIFVGLELTPVFRTTVQDLKATDKLRFDDEAISYPVELSNIERGKYYVQVVFDLNLGDANIGTSAGNLYSKTIQIDITKNFDEVFKVTATEVIDTIQFNGTELLKELSVKSNLLSDFHQKDIFVNAGVSLPKDYFNQPNKKYPVVFSTFGFGANYKTGSGRKDFLTKLGDQPAIVIYLDGGCPEGHSTYANSDINGPWGDALVNEFIPALNKKYRTNGANLLYGHSSGGWTTLWLQVNYPKTFIGAWSSAPDQVDFRNYQNKNIYETKNMFYNQKGSLLYDVTIAGFIPVVSAKDFYRTENVIYRGSQLHSFDAVFGGYDKQGNQIRLVDVSTGAINQNALPLWKRYDLSIILKNNWNSLKEDLDQKIRISVGTGDNFHLDKAVKLLEKEMTKINATIEFDYFAGDHFTVFTEEYIQKGNKFLTQCYTNWLKSQ